MKSLFLILIFLSLSFYVKSQKRNLTDSLKAFAVNLIEKARNKQQFDNITIAKFTNLTGGESGLGSYISMRFGIYVEEANKASVIDIDNLQSILKGKNVDIKNLLDEKTVIELRKHKIDAVVVGRVGENDRSSEFELLVRVMSITGTVTSLASAQAYFQKDSRMIAVADELPLNNNPPVFSATALNQSPAETELPDYPINSLCAKMNVGDVSFTNSRNRDVLIKIYSTENTGFQRNQSYNNGTVYNQSNQTGTYSIPWGNDNGGWNYGANNNGWGNVTNNSFRPATSTWQEDLLVGIVGAIKIRKQPRTGTSAEVLRTIIVKANSSETVTDLFAGIYEYGIYSTNPKARTDIYVRSGYFQIKKCVDNPVTVE